MIAVTLFEKCFRHLVITVLIIIAFSLNVKSFLANYLRSFYD
nr:MAG TPA: hypothetical protein [Caudoviricetes sp.]